MQVESKFHNNILEILFAKFRNIIQVSKIGTFQGNFSKISLKVLNIYLISKIFQKVQIVMLGWNILQYLTKISRRYFNCSEILEIFLASFCNILCYVGSFLTVRKFYFTFISWIYRSGTCFILVLLPWKAKKVMILFSGLLK